MTIGACLGGIAVVTGLLGAAMAAVAATVLIGLRKKVTIRGQHDAQDRARCRQPATVEVRPHMPALDDVGPEVATEGLAAVALTVAREQSAGMPIRKPPPGTRGVRTPPGALGRVMTPLMIRVHRLTGNRFAGMELLYLTAVGARSGQPRTTPVARFDDGRGGWLIVASAGGAATHPGWYHNVVAHPDDVVAEVDGVRHAVTVEQLDGDERAQAWQKLVAAAPRFGDYETKTDRTIPILRLTPRPTL
jgi:deazaflavin-dependent oxidoreductase (nitroreductase family)